MTKLSVNINKIATIRNARGGNVPDVIETAKNIEAFGAQGITVHPRPDGRHIRFDDVRMLSNVITTELNIEGYPSRDWLNLVLEVKPAQATLVPDAPEAITSNAGWDTIARQKELQIIISELKAAGIRTSIFVDPDLSMVEAALATGTDRIELYTESYATHFQINKHDAIEPFIQASEKANSIGLGINAGHDLNLENLHFFQTELSYLDEVSIGHALISDALYYGLENAVQMYLSKLS
jgi:pyridoxine 5-phosphate synthase